MTQHLARTNRRTVLKLMASTGVASLLAGCASSGQPDRSTGGTNDPDDPFDGYLADVGNYNGVTDATDSTTVTIAVGAQGNGGTFAFDPAAVRITTGTTVTFRWVSSTHNVAVVDQPPDASWDGESDIKNDGYSFDSTFDTEGVYTYVCDPHEQLEMKGGIIVE